VEKISIKEVLRKELTETKVLYHELLSSVPIESYSMPTSNPAWNVAEILFHICLAPRYIASDVVFIRRFSWIPKPPAFLFHALNEWMTKKGAIGVTPQYLAEKYDEAHERMMKSLNTISEEVWGKGADYPGWDPLLSGYVTLERLFHYPAEHFRTHAQELKFVAALR